MGMTSLKMSSKDREQMAIPSYGPSDEYPYGARLTLEGPQLKKLGIKDMPTVGSPMMFEAKARVIAVSDSNGVKRLELQITDIDLEAGELGEEVKEGELTRKGAGAIERVARRMRGM